MTEQEADLLCAYFSVAQMDIDEDVPLSDVTMDSVRGFSLGEVHRLIREFQQKGVK